MNTPLAFVTGGTGLVGSHLLYDLLQKGYRVKALKRPKSDRFQALKTFGYFYVAIQIFLILFFLKKDYLYSNYLIYFCFRE